MIVQYLPGSRKCHTGTRAQRARPTPRPPLAASLITAKPSPLLTAPDPSCAAVDPPPPAPSRPPSPRHARRRLAGAPRR